MMCEAEHFGCLALSCKVVKNSHYGEKRRTRNHHSITIQDIIYEGKPFDVNFCQFLVKQNVNGTPIWT